MAQHGLLQPYGCKQFTIPAFPPPPLTRFLFSVICGVSDCTAACTDASLCHTAARGGREAHGRSKGGQSGGPSRAEQEAPSMPSQPTAGAGPTACSHTATNHSTVHLAACTHPCRAAQGSRRPAWQPASPGADPAALPGRPPPHAPPPAPANRAPAVKSGVRHHGPQAVREPLQIPLPTVGGQPRQARVAAQRGTAHAVHLSAGTHPPVHWRPPAHGRRGQTGPGTPAPSAAGPGPRQSSPAGTPSPSAGGGAEGAGQAEGARGGQPDRGCNT